MCNLFKRLKADLDRLVSEMGDLATPEIVPSDPYERQAWAQEKAEALDIWHASVMICRELGEWDQIHEGISYKARGTYADDTLDIRVLRNGAGGYSHTDIDIKVDGDLVFLGQMSSYSHDMQKFHYGPWCDVFVEKAKIVRGIYQEQLEKRKEQRERELLSDFAPL